MLPFTTDCDVVLGGVDIALPGEVPVALVALIKSGELPDWLVPGRKKVPDHSRVEFHRAKFQFGLEVVPKFDITYLSCSPTGPCTIVPVGTPVTLNSWSPVSASKTRAKLDVHKSAGYTPCWLPFCRSHINAKFMTGTSLRCQRTCPVRRSTHVVGPALEPRNDRGGL